ncbi:cyanoexosortase A [Cylindrospermum sp. FACHB-282]|uniref:cyanoexosortase A n=1 Tax=Cylindrospermum sp. FACHB-282 TaxID=2692794 RepID=UPI0018EFA943|nr:cyanoexosortase A [Cylindrospermum sp. FACHB-282]
MNNLSSLKFFKHEPFWLLSIAAALEAICITLVWRADDSGHLAMNILFLCATGSLLWDKRHKLTFETGVLPSIVGIVLIGWVLWQSATLNVDHTLRLLSFTSALGVSLLASGFKGLKQYWEELIILFFLGVPSVVAKLLFDLSPLTARFSGLILWYLGFDVSVTGISVHLPKGSIKVVYECSGIDIITYILGIAVIALVMFPIARSKRLLVAIFGIILGFFINAVRVAMLALMAGANHAAFDDWHGGKASYSFALIAILIFGAVYMFLLWQEEQQAKNIQKPEEV